MKATTAVAFTVVLVTLLSLATSFGVTPATRTLSRVTSRSFVDMEYIPDGMSKAQWEKVY